MPLTAREATQTFSDSYSVADHIKVSRAIWYKAALAERRRRTLVTVRRASVASLVHQDIRLKLWTGRDDGGREMTVLSDL